MKLIKKIAAIMFAFMVVVSMSCSVKADEGTTATTEKGTITINNAIPEQTYTIYKILDLESYDKAKNNYSYKPANGWETFIDQNDEYFIKNEYDGISWKASEGETEAQKQERASTLAKKALDYAKDSSHSITNSGKETAGSTTVTFSGLDLGYYLVDSSVGALCSLNTTNPTVEIQEKNGVPTVEKIIVDSNKDETDNYANIGDVIKYKTIITAQGGAQNYVLHDTMDKGLTFNDDVKVKKSGETEDLIQNQDYELITNPTDKTCTFEIKFIDTFLKAINAETKIEVTYSATLNGDAKIYEANENTTYLTYGNNNKTTDRKTHTVSYEIKVLKYTKTTDNPLANATFSLYNAETAGMPYKLVQKTGTTDYRLAMTGQSGITEITTNDKGKFSIQGLKPGDYWLEETAAPKGYNKLTKRIKVHINEAGNYVINDENTGSPISQVEVENKSGTVLPSTGGAGTTMIYLVGAVLVLGSGVVLATKRRVKNK